MNKQTILLMALSAAVTAGLMWNSQQPRANGQKASAVTDGRKVLYYQSAMHPWIKSDKPGKCTICGMDLVPVYEGEKGFDMEKGSVSLGTNSIQVIHVQSAEVKRQPLRRSLEVAGMIDDDDSRHRILSAYVEGRVDQLFVNYVGAEVTKGQPLATIYSPALLAMEREYVALRKRGAVPTVLQAEQLRLVDAAAERLRRLGLNDTQIAALPDKPENDAHTEILAPMSGTVVSRAVYVGQYVKEGERLFEIADFTTMWFVFDVYERDLPWLKLGQMVDITTPSVPGRVFRAPITFIDPNLNEATRSAKVRVEIKNPSGDRALHLQHELLHKLYAEARVEVETPEALVVPRVAVLSPNGNPVVYLDKGGGVYEQHHVKLGRAGDNVWEVLDGLQAGDRVVLNGNLLIDAQAELNQTVQAAQPLMADGMTNAPVNLNLNDAQQASVGEMLEVMSRIATALSSDDLMAFNRESVKLSLVLPPLQQALSADAAGKALADKLSQAGVFGPAADLAAARKAFLPLSNAAVELAQAVRAHPVFQSVKIYQCPMTAKAVPGAPKKAYWLQLQEPLRNPYFGSEMIDCGTEVKP